MRYFPNIEFRLPKQSQSFDNDLDKLLSNQEYFEIQNKDYSTLHYKKAHSLIKINKPLILQKLSIDFTENEGFWYINLKIVKAFKIIIPIIFSISTLIPIYILTLHFSLGIVIFSLIFSGYPVLLVYIMMKRDINIWNKQINEIIKTPNTI